MLKILESDFKPGLSQPRNEKGGSFATKVSSSLHLYVLNCYK